jgi:heme/copper-type cytochrome/quinol oxidase subunit 2
MNLSKITTALLLAAAATAGACPDCSIKNNTTLVEQGSTTAKQALSDNTLFMIAVVLGVLGFMVWMMVKTCRDLAKERGLSSTQAG